MPNATRWDDSSWMSWSMACSDPNPLHSSWRSFAVCVCVAAMPSSSGVRRSRSSSTSRTLRCRRSIPPACWHGQRCAGRSRREAWPDACGFPARSMTACRKAAVTDPAAYDPFGRGRFPVGVRTSQGLDPARNRRFQCEIWYPAAAQHAGQDLAPATQDVFAVPASTASRRQMAVRGAASQPGTHPLIVFSHSSGGNRQQSTFLCTHLSSHGYLVAALDHSELVAAELARKPGETGEQKAARVAAWIANRVPDIRFLVDHLLDDAVWDAEARPDSARIGVIGHSFGGWTALAATETDARIRAVVALAPGGSSRPRPGVIPATLAFNWGRDVPTLYLVAENDS